MKIFWPVSLIVIASLTIISSISERLFLLQAAWALVGLGIVFFFALVDWRAVLNHRGFVWGVYGLTVILLVVARFFSPAIRNVRGWIVLGPFTFQPVELAKIALILIYAQYFSRRHLAIARWEHILVSFLIFVIPAGLVLIQPDMGSALILFGIWFGFLLVSGLPRRRIVAALLVFAALGVFGWHYVLEDYQRDRITGVFYPGENALTVNYQQIQARIAIGSAGFWGKGYDQGTQTQLGFLTESANDFVLAALIEEWGLAAGILVIAAFAVLIYEILKIGYFARQNFQKFFCLGVSIVFALQFLINAGSTVGLLPVVGVTFPFLSYGGSSLLTDFFLLAIIYSISRRTT